MEYTKTPWRIRKQDILGNEQNGYICSWSGRSADARLIVTAVNTCASVNPDNPMAVAESIKEMYEALKGLMEALECAGSESQSVRIAYNLAKPVLSKAEKGA